MSIFLNDGANKRAYGELVLGLVVRELVSHPDEETVEVELAPVVEPLDAVPRLTLLRFECGDVDCMEPVLKLIPRRETVRVGYGLANLFDGVGAHVVVVHIRLPPFFQIESTNRFSVAHNLAIVVSNEDAISWQRNRILRGRVPSPATRCGTRDCGTSQSLHSASWLLGRLGACASSSDVHILCHCSEQVHFGDFLHRLGSFDLSVHECPDVACIACLVRKLALHLLCQLVGWNEFLEQREA